MKHLILLLFFSLSAGFLLAQTNFQSYGGSSGVGEFQVFPNPAVDYIQVSDNDDIQRIALFNLAGREIKSFTYRSAEKYFVGDLPKGMYLIQFLGPQNRRLSTRRINIR